MQGAPLRRRRPRRRDVCSSEVPADCPSCPKERRAPPPCRVSQPPSLRAGGRWGLHRRRRRPPRRAPSLLASPAWGESPCRSEGRSCPILCPIVWLGATSSHALAPTRRGEPEESEQRPRWPGRRRCSGGAAGTAIVRDRRIGGVCSGASTASGGLDRPVLRIVPQLELVVDALRVV